VQEPWCNLALSAKELAKSDVQTGPLPRSSFRRPRMQNVTTSSTYSRLTSSAAAVCFRVPRKTHARTQHMQVGQTGKIGRAEPGIIAGSPCDQQLAGMKELQSDSLRINRNE